MGDILKLTIVLVAISVIAAGLLAFTYSKTKGAIENQQQKTEQEALTEVLPEGSAITAVEGFGDQPSRYWVATRNGDTAGYAFQVSSRGYSGEIVSMVGVDKKGTIIGLKILQQTETPGLGTRTQESVSKRYVWNGLFKPAEDIKPWFSEQFEGLSVLRPIGIDKSRGEWHLLDSQARQTLEEENRVTAITGATISTRAVISGLENKAALYLRAIRRTN